jgi:hypothetical protein
MPELNQPTAQFQDRRMRLNGNTEGYGGVGPDKLGTYRLMEEAKRMHSDVLRLPLARRGSREYISGCSAPFDALR